MTRRNNALLLIWLVLWSGFLLPCLEAVRPTIAGFDVIATQQFSSDSVIPQVMETTRDFLSDPQNTRLLGMIRQAASDLSGRRMFDVRPLLREAQINPMVLPAHVREWVENQQRGNLAHVVRRLLRDLNIPSRTREGLEQVFASRDNSVRGLWMRLERFWVRSEQYVGELMSHHRRLMGLRGFGDQDAEYGEFNRVSLIIFSVMLGAYIWTIPAHIQSNYRLTDNARTNMARLWSLIRFALIVPMGIALYIGTYPWLTFASVFIEVFMCFGMFIIENHVWDRTNSQPLQDSIPAIRQNVERAHAEAGGTEMSVIVRNDLDIERVIHSLGLEKNAEPFQGSECTICLDDLVVDEDSAKGTQRVELPCHHQYHRDCLKNALEYAVRNDQLIKCGRCQTEYTIDDVKEYSAVRSETSASDE